MRKSLISRCDKILTRFAPENVRKRSARNRLKAVQEMQSFKRIKLPKNETIEDLRAEGRR